ncbi:homeobox protein DBX2 isoform X2 [Sapajus apella]|uniref:Homeobox protein DBX2 isoform X2 n=2 Tax=Cebinae TaxID=38070 RepID=A0A6J3FF09_SAPAP|nr:homeobox protein DBX2 isoform X2 [Sapajus apella]
MGGLDTPSVLPKKKKKKKTVQICIETGRDSLPRSQSLRSGPGNTASPSHTHSSHPLKKRPTQINNIVPSPLPSRVASPSRPAPRAPALRQTAARSGGSACGAGRTSERRAKAGAQRASPRRTMLPSAVAAHAGAYWDVVASSALLNLPAAPGFGNLGKSFLIENLLRVGGSPTPGLQPPAPHGPAAALATASAQLRPLPASPVPLKLCPAAGQVSSAGAPYGTRWAFQVLSPSTDSARLPGRAPGDRDSTFQPSAPAPSKPFLLSAPPFYLACCGGSCQRPASSAAFPREESVLPLLAQDSNSKARRGILRRAVFSEDQRKALEKMFQKQKYISKTDRKKLAINLGLKESQNRRMKWRNSKEKEVLSNRCIQEVGLQEDPLSRSALGFPSPCPSIWDVPQQHASPRWRENSPEPSERLIQESSGAPPPEANSLQGGLYLCSEEEAGSKGVLTGAI